MCKFILFIVPSLFLIDFVASESSSAAISWYQFIRKMSNEVEKCPPEMAIFACLKDSSVKIFEEITQEAVIPLTESARLVKNDGGNLSPLHRQEMNLPWSSRIFRRFIRAFRTHSLQLDLIETARHRRRNQMLPFMLLGVTGLGVIIIPLGFQFLAVLAGKAFLMAKMALLLASINGIKRIATSGVHYGLYHSDPPHFQGGVPHPGAYWHHPAPVYRRRRK